MRKMTVNEFSDACHATSTYSDEAIAHGVLITGMSEEFGEASEAYIKAVNDNSEENRASMAMELMDCAWYAFETIRSLGYNANESMLDYGIKPTEDSISLRDITLFALEPEVDYIPMVALMSDLSVSIGEICGQFKRIWRDEGGVYSVDRVQRIKHECVHTIIAITRLLGVVCICSLDDAAEKLIAKLNSRKQRGCIHGEGSNR